MPRTHTHLCARDHCGAPGSPIAPVDPNSCLVSLEGSCSRWRQPGLAPRLRSRPPLTNTARLGAVPVRLVTPHTQRVACHADSTGASSVRPEACVHTQARPLLVFCASWLSHNGATGAASTGRSLHMAIVQPGVQWAQGLMGCVSITPHNRGSCGMGRVDCGLWTLDCAS